MWESLVATLIVAAPSYTAVRSDAAPIKSLGRFLEQYVGDCESEDPEFDKRGCEAAAASAREGMAGKLLRLELDDPSEVLAFADWDARRSAFRLHFTPFLSDRGVGLSAGKPTGLTPAGQPIVKNIPLWVPLPKGEAEFGFRRQLERGMVRLEIIFKPGKVWAMQRRGESPVRGVAVEIVGVRVLARGDQVLSEETYR
jgi:hypothetical protein